jgi:hypothetical protein
VRRIGAGIVVTVVAAAVAIAIARSRSGAQEDWPPIIVRQGSILFESGVPGRWKPWRQDAFLAEWKPEHAKGAPVTAFEVTFTGVPPPAGCAEPLRGRTIWIHYTNDGSNDFRFRIHARRQWIVGRGEPKIDAGSTPLSHHIVPPGTPPAIAYEDVRHGWITKVSVDRTECVFPKPDAAARTAFRARIQPR